MIRGIGTSKGIGIGNAVLIDIPDIKVSDRVVDNIDEEIIRYNGAKNEFVKQCEAAEKNLQKKLKGNDKTALILKNQIYLINDEELNKGVCSIIRDEHMCAESALVRTCEIYENLFASMDSEAMNQRVADIKDMKQGMLRKLLGIKEINLGKLESNTIIIAYELTPSITALMDTKHVAGIVAEKGGETSHAAILARSLEIPAVLSVKDICKNVNNGDLLIVDGVYGEVFLNPLPVTLKIFEKKRQRFIKKNNELKEYINKSTLSKDGKKFMLCANIGDSEDAVKAVESGAEGVGLFRTEFLFMNSTAMPTEDEQFNAYKKAAVVLNGKPLTIRTLDIGGDKNIPYMGLTAESNPFLGYRAIRYCLSRPDVYETQIKAILRASAYGSIRIMIPMVTCVDEIQATKRIIKYSMKELDKKNIKYDKHIQVGIMVETPAAAALADVMAKESDFFSIGTNDLTQYMMAVDRGNENVAYLYSTFNPAVLRAIHNIIKAGKEAGIEVGMCGEAAGSEMMIPLLLSFGLDEFSVSPAKVLETRKNISVWTIDEARNIEKQVMEMSSEKDVFEYISSNVAARNEKEAKEGKNGKDI